MMETGYSLADIAAATGNSGNNNNDGWGGNNGWWIIILLLALGRGYGFGGGYGGGNGGGYSQPIVIDSGRSGGSCGCCSPCATQADLAAGFNNSAVLANLNDLALGQANIQQTLCQGFNGVNTAILQSGYNTQAGLNGISHQLSDCCCATQRAIDGVKYAIAEQSCDTRHTIYNSTRDIIDNANANSRAVLDFLVQSKLADKDARIAMLEGQVARADQNAVLRAAIDASTAEIIRRTGNDCPVPAFVVQPSTPVSFPTNCCGQVNYAGYNNGCGCGNSNF